MDLSPYMHPMPASNLFQKPGETHRTDLGDTGRRGGGQNVCLSAILNFTHGLASQKQALGFHSASYPHMRK